MCSVPKYRVDDVIVKFVEKLSNVKHLKLSSIIIERLELANVLSASFPTFINLITLEAFFIKTQQVESLFAFLRFSPNLESLVFTGVYDDDGVYEDAWTLDVVPHCLLMHLKSVEFHYFIGDLMELDLVQLFLQNAGVLQTVIIGIPSLLYHTTKDVEDFIKKVMGQLVKYKWASTDCVIKFELSFPPLL
ncbi:hypothetical protein MKW98_024953 [Papaver atlanticum]|uniref:FBD domain-containing protein n=1 Tax=Papaver atlanticum TaxID=357466 RepID=A0AAD4T1T2_9MAGN|nr:hypothetical protein MKW98_024953 [Papaver atlanticum]